jgi:hypothetical protein
LFFGESKVHGGIVPAERDAAPLQLCTLAYT